MIEIRHSEVNTAKQSQQAYDGIYSGTGIRHRDAFYVWLLGLVQPKPGTKLLDVSCGEGKLVELARRRGVFACGVDFSVSAVLRATSDTQLREFAVADGTSLPFRDASFDIITCIGSLEHFVDPSAGVREISRVMAPGARACILLPNTFSLLGNVDYARRYGDIFDDGQPIQRYNTRCGWQRLLENNGLRVIAVHKWELTRPCSVGDYLWYARRPRKLAHYLIGTILPLNLANCFVYICEAE